jgi:transposase
MDEGRFGRISVLSDCWAPAGVRPKVARQVVRESLYAFAAVSLPDATLTWRLSAKCDTEAMSLFLLDVLAAYPGQTLVLFLDGAGWHKAKRLPRAERMHLEYLPAYSPECNPVEHVWDEIREKGFANRYFETLEAVETQLKTQLELLGADTPRLRSLCLFDWIKTELLNV